MSGWRKTITYGKCVDRIHGVKKDYCAHFVAGGKEGTPEAFFCRGCGCHICYHEKHVETMFDRSAATVVYGVCVKNHAPHTGGSWVDGCGEFVAAGEEGTPEALSCAACGCHRSFHRKIIGN